VILTRQLCVNLEPSHPLELQKISFFIVQ